MSALSGLDDRSETSSPEAAAAAVAVAQQVLRAAGYRSVPVDGRLGASTLAALRAADGTAPTPARAGPSPQPGPNQASRSAVARRVVGFCSPYIAIASGAATAWLGRHFPGLATYGSQDTQLLIQAAEFALGTVVTWALHHKFFLDWQRWETTLANAQQTSSSGS